MKRIIVIIWAVLMIALLVGCRRDGVVRHEESRFKVVERWADCYVLVDTQTGIGYLKLSNANESGLTVMYDFDGNIYRPNGWRDYGN